MAYGSVPIFLPVWWPHSWYNTRYGMEMLPALALGLGFAAQFALAAVREFKPRVRRAMGAAARAVCRLVGPTRWQMVRERPLVYVEGTKNIAGAPRLTRWRFLRCCAALLAERPGGVVLMNTSVYPEIVAFTGIPLRQTINESDLEFISAALAAPAGARGDCAGL